MTTEPDPLLTPVLIQTSEIPRLRQALRVAVNIIGERAEGAVPEHPIREDVVQLATLLRVLSKVPLPGVAGARIRSMSLVPEGEGTGWIATDERLLTDDGRVIDMDEPAPDLDPEQHFGHEPVRQHIADGGPCWCDPLIAHVAVAEGWPDEDFPEKDWPIPRYAMLDIWVALHGAENSESFEHYAERFGFAETWARICGMVRDRQYVVSGEGEYEDDGLESYKWGVETADGHVSHVAAEDYVIRATLEALGFEADTDPVYAARKRMRQLEEAKGVRAKSKTIKSENVEATMAAEPIEQRLARAYKNGLEQGLDLGHRAFGNWDHH